MGRQQLQHSVVRNCETRRLDITVHTGTPEPLHTPVWAYDLATQAGQNACDGLSQAQQDVGLRVTGPSRPAATGTARLGGAGRTCWREAQPRLTDHGHRMGRGTI